MYKDSKIISFVYGFGDMIAESSKHSYFCRLILKLAQYMKNAWRNSITGQIVDSFFNIEVHRNSATYRFITKFIMSVLNFINNIFRLEQGITESKYFALINYSGHKIPKKEKNKSGLNTILMDSFYVKSIYEFWKTVD